MTTQYRGLAWTRFFFSKLDSAEGGLSCNTAHPPQSATLGLAPQFGLPVQGSNHHCRKGGFQATHCLIGTRRPDSAPPAMDAANTAPRLSGGALL